MNKRQRKKQVKKSLNSSASNSFKLSPNNTSDWHMTDKIGLMSWDPVAELVTPFKGIQAQNQSMLNTSVIYPIKVKHLSMWPSIKDL